mgnify:CR=1 FL=1
MPTLTITKNYDDGTTPVAAHIAPFSDDFQTFCNTTKLDSDNLNSGTLATANFQDGCLDNINYFATDSIGTAEIVDANVTRVKRASVVNSFSTTTGSTNVATTSETTIKSVSVTTNGRPVMLMLVNNESSTGLIQANDSSASKDFTYDIRFKRDGTAVAWLRHVFFTFAAGSIQIPPSAFAHVDQPAAGSYTYSATIQNSAALDSADLQNLKLVAYEL